jgi:hypothetical protein
MKYLKKFENFDLGRFTDEEEIVGDNEMGNEEECEPCSSGDDWNEEGYDNDEYSFSDIEDKREEEEEEYEEEVRRIRRWGDEDIEEVDEKKKEKGVSYKKSGLKHPEKADLNKDKKISKYEKTRGKAVQKAVQEEEEEKGGKGLTAAQKKLPEGLRKAIEAKNKKK